MDFSEAMEAWFKDRVQTIYESPPDPEWFTELEKDRSVSIALNVRPDILVFTTNLDNQDGQGPAIFQELSKAMQVGLGDNFTQLDDRVYLARQITATVEGVTIYGIKDYIQQTWNDRGWPELFSYIFPEQITLKGDDACVFTGKFINGSNQVEAVKFALSLDKRPQLIHKAKYIKPWLFDMAIVKDKLAELLKKLVDLNAPKPGNLPEITKETYDLYLTVSLYQAQGLTLENACGEAVDNYPELVPEAWNDNYETLKRKVTRINSKYPALAKNIGWVNDS